jgi:hypothetical protein
VQNPDLGNEADEEEMKEVEVIELEEEEEKWKEQEGEGEEEEFLVSSYRKYSPLSTRSGKVRS